MRLDVLFVMILIIFVLFVVVLIIVISTYVSRKKDKFKSFARIKKIPSRLFTQNIKLKNLKIYKLPLDINLNGNINILRFFVEDLHLSKYTGIFMLVYLYKWVSEGYVKYTNGQLNFTVKNIKDVATDGENSLYEILNKTMKMDFRNKSAVLMYLKKNEKNFYRRIDRLQMEAMLYFDDNKLVLDSGKTMSLYSEKGHSYLEKIYSYKKYILRSNNINWESLSLDERYLYLLFDGKISKLKNISDKEVALFKLLSEYKKGYTFIYQKYMTLLNNSGLTFTRTGHTINGEIVDYEYLATPEERNKAKEASKSPINI